MSTGKKITASIILLLLIIAGIAPAQGTGLKEVYTILLKNTRGEESWLPFIGEEPVIILYEDFRNVDNYRDIYVKTLKQPGLYEKVKFIYISNTAPARFTPDSAIYLFFREKETIYSRVTFLIDTGRYLQKKWRLLDSDRKTVIIAVSRKGEIINIQYVPHMKSAVEKVIDKLIDLADF